MTPALAIANVAALLVTAAIGIWRAKRGNIEIHTSVWDKDPGEEDAPTPTTK